MPFNSENAFIKYTLSDFTCPITHLLFFEPVSASSKDGPCGHTFERKECAWKLQKCPCCQVNITLYSAALLTKNTLDQILLSHPALWEEVYFNLDHFAETFMQKNGLKTPVFLRFITLLKNASNHLNDKALDGKQIGKTAIEILMSTAFGRDIVRKNLKMNVVDEKEVYYFGEAVISEASLKIQVNGASIRVWFNPALLIAQEEMTRVAIIKLAALFPLHLPDNIVRLILEYASGKDKIHQVSTQFLRLLISRDVTEEKNAHVMLLSNYLKQRFPNLNYKSSGYDANKKTFIHLRKPYFYLFCNKLVSTKSREDCYDRIALAITDGKEKQNVFKNDIHDLEEKSAVLLPLIFLSNFHLVFFIAYLSGFLTKYGLVEKGQGPIVLSHENESTTCDILGNATNTADFLWPNQEIGWSANLLFKAFCREFQVADYCVDTFRMLFHPKPIFSMSRWGQEGRELNLLSFFGRNIKQLLDFKFYCADASFLSSDLMLALAIIVFVFLSMINIALLSAYKDGYFDKRFKKSNIKAFEAFYDLTNLYKQREKNNTVAPPQNNSLFNFFHFKLSNHKKAVLALNAAPQL